jgi:hypothetical protein
MFGSISILMTGDAQADRGRDAAPPPGDAAARAAELGVQPCVSSAFPTTTAP